MNVQKGFRDKLEKYADTGRDIEIELSVSGGAVYDFTCFGVDASNKLSDDRYMVFYNQTASPGNEIIYSPKMNGALFKVNLSALPASVCKLVFTASIDGDGTMGNISSHTAAVKQNGQTCLELSLTGSDFEREKAVISVEIYRKDVWRFSAVAAGFNGGLSDLLRAYGGVEAEDVQPSGQTQTTQSVRNTAPVNQPVQNTAPQHVQNAAPVYQPVQNPTPQPMQNAAPAYQPVQNQAPQPVQNSAPVYQSVQPSVPAPTAGRISLEKKLEAEAPKLVSLAKPLKVELEKRNLLDCVAKVALVMDISGSMSARYSNGTVQEIVNKTLPLAVQFDDDGELDFWYFGSSFKRMPSVNMRNYESAVPSDWEHLMSKLGGGTNAHPVMKSVLNEFGNSRIPAYVLFITDGAFNFEWEVKSFMKKASKYPIFWQFVGVGGSNYGYGFLRRIDEMKGRYVDNANFFALDDFKKVSNEELYSRLLNEFPSWLNEIKRKGMI